MALRPSSLVILQAYAALVVLFSLTVWWFVMVTEIKYVSLINENGVINIIGHQNISLYLDTKDGKVLVQGINSTGLMVSNNKIFIQSPNANGNLISNDNISVSCNGETCSSSTKIRDVVGRETIEATQQAERKNMNKSLAFASASHDVRTSLAGLTGLLNSILDTSKIEAGKMHLEEEDFDLSHLLEDVVDLYHPVGMKKGVDIVLDPCNGSLMRYSHVKGDRGKLKQVLCNLLSNAVKFTDEGHIAVRAWARKSNLQNSIMDTNNYSFIKHLTRFNVVLTACGIMRNGSRREGTEYGLGDRNNAQGLNFRSNSSGSSIYNSLSPGLRIYSYNPRPQASHVVLLIADKERQRISQRFMESLGIKVKVVNQWKNLLETLDKIKQKGDYSCNQSSSVPSDLSFRSTSHTLFPRSIGIHLTSVSRTDPMPSVFKKTDNIGTVPCFILIIIDANAGPVSELCSMVSSFRKGLLNPSKVVWLNKPLLHGNNFKILDKDLLDPNDIVLSKPFHGSRLIQILELLPEYDVAWKSSYSRSKRESAIDHRVGNTCIESSLSKHNTPFHDKPQVEINTIGTSFKCTEQIMKGSEGEKEECEGSSNKKALSGKKVLVVEDNALLRKLALATLVPLGATIEQCENGEEAVQLVKEGLSRTDIPNLPYDYILMDCEMPVMNGFEATRQIREMEKLNGIRIPIIALTAHSDNIVTEDGMDFHLVKPIKGERVLEAIRHVHEIESV
ncbi:unnamed protein product [Lupinus luteus]|uniref:histidine kinase n=1 Tax=Lupinus luteus TaxID=3873 RepID=A0AAV1X4K8_LUPLU